jgi:tight adherence protein C
VILLALTVNEMLPLIVFLIFMLGAWGALSLLSQGKSKAEERLEQLGRSRSSPDLDMSAAEAQKNRFSGLKDAISSLGGAMEPQSALEKNNLKVRLANAGFRSESAPMVYHGIRLISLVICLLPAIAIFLYKDGFSLKAAQYIVIFGGIGFYLPQAGLWYLRSTRQKEIFLTLPDALDLLVVCVESGLGLDAALRKVTDEMKEHAKTICEEFAIGNMQLQMGRPRREVLHDLGVRTGVDDMRALAAILIQADRFGSSIAQALRVQSDSMRIRRRQLAEEKAAKTAVQLIFPLVLFIFPAIFVVLVGPAAIQIQKGLLKN